MTVFTDALFDATNKPTLYYDHYCC